MKANWREEVLYAVTLLMESCWIGALLLFLNELVAGGPQFSIIWLWLMYPFAFLLNRLLCNLGWGRYYSYAINGLAMIVGMLLVLKTQLYAAYNMLDGSWLSALGANLSQLFQAFQPEVLAIIGCGLLFWRGWRLAQHRVTFAAVGTGFQFGLSILLIVLFISQLIDISLPNAILLVIAFAFLALVGVGLCRSTEVSTHGSHLLLVTIVLIILLGSLVGAFVTSDLLHILLDALRWLWGIILKIIAFLLSLLPERAPAELPPATTPIPESPPAETYHIWTLPEPIRDILSKVWIVGFVTLIVIALYRMLSDIWHRLRGALTRGATIEPLPMTFRANILGALIRLIHRILGIPLKLAYRHKKVTQSQEVSSIRHIYRNLLQWGAEAGWPRRISETPYEYLETLTSTLSREGQGQLSCITEAYVIARYRQNWENREPLQQIKESWEKLRRFRLKKAS